MNDSVSMEVLARFAILPGAASLVEAFCDIPPGPMRDAVIHLAQTTAQTYRGQPGVQPTYNPIPPIGQRAPARIASRTGREPPTESPEMLAVKLRIEGLSVNDIMAKTGLERQQVYQAVYAARKAGAPIPPTRKKTGPVEVGSKSWATSLDQLSGQGQRMVAIAATSRGLTPQQYLDRRQLALKLAQEGAGYERILKATGEASAKVVSAWLSAARGAGYNVPYVVGVSLADHELEAAQPEPPPPEPEPAPEPPIVRVFDNMGSGNGAATAITRAAERRNMTVGAYQDLRESIVQHRMNGKAPLEIATLTGEPTYFVKDTIDMAITRGVKFPALTIHRKTG